MILIIYIPLGGGRNLQNCDAFIEAYQSIIWTPTSKLIMRAMIKVRSSRTGDLISRLNCGSRVNDFKYTKTGNTVVCWAWNPLPFIDNYQSYKFNTIFFHPLLSNFSGRSPLSCRHEKLFLYLSLQLKLLILAVSKNIDFDYTLSARFGLQVVLLKAEIQTIFFSKYIKVTFQKALPLFQYEPLSCKSVVISEQKL